MLEHTLLQDLLNVRNALQDIIRGHLHRYVSCVKLELMLMRDNLCVNHAWPVPLVLRVLVCVLLVLMAISQDLVHQVVTRVATDNCSPHTTLAPLPLPQQAVCGEMPSLSRCYNSASLHVLR